MPQQTTITPTPAQQSTCETCPKFQDFNDRGRGLCQVFDKVVRKHHLFTSDCRTAIEAEELKVLLMTSNAFLKPIALGETHLIAEIVARIRFESDQKSVRSLVITLERSPAQ